MADAAQLTEVVASARKETRKLPRIPCRRDVILRTSEGCEFLAICTDVVLGGMGVDSEQVLMVGQRVQLVLDEAESVLMLVLYRTGKHYGLGAISAPERVLELLPLQS